MHKKFKQKNPISAYDEIKKKNEDNKNLTIKIDEDWERQICSCSQKRLLYINTKKAQIKKYDYDLYVYDVVFRNAKKCNCKYESGDLREI